MSVLIRGMKMPKNCGECVFSNRETNSCFLFSQGCVDRYNINLSIKQEWCELVELTPHGRLIDVDALEIQDGWLSDDMERNVLQTHITFVYSNDIVNAPTIITAEEVSE